MSRSYSSSGQQIPMVRNGSSGGSNGETKNSTEKVLEKTSSINNNNNNNVPAAAAPLKYSDDDHRCPDEKFEEFINRIRDETRRVGTTTITTTTTTKPAVIGFPLTSAWRSVPNNPRNNNSSSTNNNARISKPISGGNAMEFLQKEVMSKKNPSFTYNGKEKEKLLSHVKTKKIIDSREASKRYGKILYRMDEEEEEEEEEEEYRGAIITSSEALKKYNGASVP